MNTSLQFGLLLGDLIYSYTLLSHLFHFTIIRRFEFSYNKLNPSPDNFNYTDTLMADQTINSFPFHSILFVVFGRENSAHALTLIIATVLKQNSVARKWSVMFRQLCRSFASNLTRQICYGEIISRKNQTCCKYACYPGSF